MARGSVSSLFHLCTRKRITFLNFKALLFNQNTSSPSQFHSFRPFSTHLLNPPFLASFSQSLNLYGVSTLPRRLFSVTGDEGGAAAEPDCELDVGTGKSVDFELGNEVSDHVYELPISEFEEKSSEFMHVASRDPIELYNELKCMGTRVMLNKSEMEVWLNVFRHFVESDWASNQALTIYIDLDSFPYCANDFQNFFRKNCLEDVAKYLLSLGPSDDAVKFLFPIFVEFCLERSPRYIEMFRSMVESAVLMEPRKWFSYYDSIYNRKGRRKIIYHCGPTNSGKTYNALQRFMEAKSGIYCGPHRLLAMEVYDKVKAKGVYCCLYTRQKKKRGRSSHVACTVEMVSKFELYDVAIIDEIHMLADPYRGYSWTDVLLSLQAGEIHLCGDPSVLDIVRKICQDTGDEFHEQQYERFKPLVVEAKTLLGNLQNIQSGDCVVAFSMREIVEVKLAIERETNHRCCVIHGDLPHETRRQQANLFNDQSNEYDVLVATDVVGMGLDLNIRRVVFNSFTKYNWDKMVRVPASQVKQIAGRAGWRGCLYPDGLVTTLHLDDLDYLIECLKQPFDHVTRVWPPGMAMVMWLNSERDTCSWSGLPPLSSIFSI